MMDSRVALVTGGGGGIGAATARRLLDEGYRVAMTGPDLARLEVLRNDLGGDEERLLCLEGDTSVDTDVERWVADTVTAYGRLDAAIANAGFATTGWLGDGDPAHWRDMILMNVLGPALVVHYTVPALARTRGRVVLVGSVAGLVPTADNLHGVTRYAVAGLAEDSRRALSQHGVGVTHIAPGRSDSEFWDRIGALPDLPYLVCDDIARTIVWALTQPDGVDVSGVTVRPTRM